jgi:hypothetical protein
MKNHLSHPTVSPNFLGRRSDAISPRESGTRKKCSFPPAAAPENKRITEWSKKKEKETAANSSKPLKRTRRV